MSRPAGRTKPSKREVAVADARRTFQQVQVEEARKWVVSAAQSAVKAWREDPKATHNAPMLELSNAVGMYDHRLQVQLSAAYTWAILDDQE